MSSNPRHTRTAATTGRGDDERMDSPEKPRVSKTFLDNWVEPALPPPAPSFTDHPHLSIERHGVLENMAPLGTMPSAKAKKLFKQDAPRKPLLMNKPEDGDASTPARAPRGMVTPEPPMNTIRRKSESRRVDDEEWNPKTPNLQASAQKSATRTGQSAASQPPPSPYQSKEERYLSITDRTVEYAVEDAILNNRWPTAYALRTLYNDHKINPRIRRLFMLIFTSQASEEQQIEFRSLMSYKKREGAKENKAQRYFDEHDNLYSPVRLFQPAWSLSGPSKRGSTEATNRASTSPHKETAHVSKKAKVNNFQQPSSHNPSNHIHLVNNNKREPAETNGNSKMKHQRQVQNGTVAASVVTRSRSVSSSSSLSSVDEAVFEGGFLAPSAAAGQGEINKTNHATEFSTREPTHSAEDAARNQDQNQPITQHTVVHVQKPHTFTAVNSNTSTTSSTTSLSKPSSTSPANKLQNGTNVMRPYLSETYTLPPSLPSLPSQLPQARSHKKGAAAALRRIITPRDEEIIRRKKEAKFKTDTTISARQSFVRTPVHAPEPGSESEAGDTIAVVSQPAVRQVLRFRRRGGDDESDNYSSPTRLSFQPELAPGSSRNSRANTPNASTRPMRKAKNSGPRMKTSPKKNPHGPSAGMPRASGQRDSPASGALHQDENDDYCSSCGGNGDLVCCDGCTRSFHIHCVDPPIGQTKLPDEWYCNLCLAARRPQTGFPRGIFGELIALLEKKNPVAFHLPKDIREYFEGVRTGVEGEYDEGPPPKKKQDDAIDYLRLKDNKGNPILCHACACSSGGTRLIISCAFCGLHWHLDCLDPPLASPPPNSVHRPWKCPCHIDDLLSLVPGSLGPSHRFRRIKGRSVIKPAMSRGIKNSGNIEVELASSDDEKDTEFFEEKEYGRVYKLPEEGIKLDFISRVHAKRRAAAHLASPYPVSTTAPPVLQPEPFHRRSLDDQQAVLNLEYLAAQAAEGDGTDALINALVAEASPAVIDLIARGSVAAAPHRKLSKVDLQALRAMRSLIDGVVATEALQNGKEAAADGKKRRRGGAGADELE